MCARYGLYADGVSLRDRFRLARMLDGWEPEPVYRPSDPVLVVGVTAEGERVARRLRWGFIPSDAGDRREARRRALINARAETVATRPTFRAALVRRRVILPMSSFVEWRRTDGKPEPVAVRRIDGAPLAAAGIWTGWRDPQTGDILRSVALVTVAANALLAPIHDRMPALLDGADAEEAWIAPATDVGAALRTLRPYPGTDLVTDARPPGVDGLRPLALTA